MPSLNHNAVVSHVPLPPPVSNMLNQSGNLLSKSVQLDYCPSRDMTTSDIEWLRKMVPSGRLLPSHDTPVVTTQSEWFATADGWMMALGPRVPLSNGQTSPTYVMCHTNEARVIDMLCRIQTIKRYAMLNYNSRGVWHAGTEITGLVNYFMIDHRFFCLYVTWNE
ncbi:hypothetical protein BDF22DRAFT_657158 [Syncephalis plumigaleata]|nr:hypothetical protein BDF22DRAFT_657158 [Syncephalis plumigaleata]